MLSTADKLHDIVHSLQPGMEEYADNSKFHYWMDYACELDTVGILTHSETSEDFISYLNKKIADKFETDPEHHACVDIAACIENAFPNEFSGKFVYQ